MRILILCIRIFDGISTRIITFLFRIQQLLTGALPAVASPDELTRYLQAHYGHAYHNAPAQCPEYSPIWPLEPWEMNLCTAFPIPRYDLKTGTVREGWECLKRTVDEAHPNHRYEYPTCDLRSYCRQGRNDA